MRMGRATKGNSRMEKGMGLGATGVKEESYFGKASGKEMYLFVKFD